jgi:hypothetical protein
MPSYDKTALWQQALAAKVDDPHSKERDRLRAAYEVVRTRAQPVAEAIARDLPDYTVHDITHSDALWEYADLVVGPNYPLNPCEAFVVGCAFLVHDLGMGLAAYPEGLPGLKKLPLWRDTVADLLRRKGVEEISDQAIEQAATDVQKQAVGEALRQLHAQRADKLALIHWTSPGEDQRFHLIEDAELREAFGPIIGRISFSHWWPVDQLAKEFVAVMGAQVGFPQSWTVDPLKLASVLRCADYCHVDERRAPAFLRALRQPADVSDDHWKFQGKLYQPRLEGDRLIFTAKSGFNIDDAGAWWVCFDTLSAVDSELRKVDSLLADTRRQRFAARGVSQADEPSRLAKLIKTDGWQPVDTRIRVSAVADLVGKLGGKDLYGDTISPPLREMIQNAADAVRARRLIDGRAADWGEIRVMTGKDDSGVWIQVEDTGVGMSEAVLTGPLLDFGSCFWGSTLMHDELPGLAAKGFQPTGRYGIGFFSVFMWGERVEVTTQRFDKGRTDTFVLSFRKGLKERPLLRQARPDEHIPDGGTRVRVWLSDKKTLERLSSTFDDIQKLTMAQVCGRIAPCLDVTLKAEGETAVAANDWLTLSDDALLKRLAPDDQPRRMKAKATYFDVAPCPPLQVLRTADGRPVGRAAIWNWEGFYTPHSKGTITVGGLRACSLGGIVGVFAGSPRRVSRDSAVPLIPLPILREWTMKERDARLSEGHPAEVLESLAEVVNALGVEPFGLPVARTASGWVTPEQIEELAKSVNEALLVHDAAVDLAGGQVAKPQLNEGVFAVDVGALTIVHTQHWDWDCFEWPPLETEQNWGDHKFYSRSIQGAVIRSLAKGWGCSLEDVLKESSFGSDEETFEREVGTLADKPYVEDVNIIRRPRTKG